MRPKKRERFIWTTEANNKLLELSTKFDNLPNKWRKIYNQFVTLFPSYVGTERSLASKLSKNNNNNFGIIQEMLTSTLSPERMAEFRSVVESFMDRDRVDKKLSLFETISETFPEIDITSEQLWMYAVQNSTNTPVPISVISQQSVFENLATLMLNGPSRINRNISTAQQYRDIVKLFREHHEEEYGSEFDGNDFFILQKILPLLALNPNRELEFLNNMDDTAILQYMELGDAISKTPIFKEMCHNCGYMFFRHNQSNRVLLDNPLNRQPMVLEHFDLNNDSPTYVSARKKFITCRYCSRNPQLHYEYSKFLPNSIKIGVPRELQMLTASERSQIALCGVFSTITQFANNYRKIFRENQGHVNIGKKRSKSYYGNFSIYYNTIRPEELPDSAQKIRTALLWLRKNNHLYKKFYSNYETLYGYLTRALQIHVNDTTIELAHGSFEDIIRNERRGAFIPADDLRINESISADEDRIGIQHPIYDTVKAAFDENKSAIKVNYRDADLEAKAWPVDHPTGTGSWKKESSLEHRDHWNWNAFNYDSRFRNNQERHFFTLDRYLKNALVYYNKKGRSVNVNNLAQQITAEDIKEDDSFYGSVVPSSVPGSRSYWASRTYDLMALVKELGVPTLFVTLTQNDNWPELQIAAGHLTAAELKDLDPGEFHPPPIIGDGVSDNPFEAVLAFRERFMEVFMKKFVNDKDGPFGTVTDHWHRLEYQERGAVHAHVLLWIDPETFNPECISAELPRYNGPDERLEKICDQARRYVEAFQVHNCVPSRCFSTKKNKKLTSCKYGFPFSITDETELPENQVRYLYQRRAAEDSRVSPYNLELLLAMQSHVNVQRVTARSLEFYLTKYITKPEQSFQAKIDTGNDVDKFLKYRVLGILECLNILLEFEASHSSRKVVFLPTELEPAYKMLKRKKHLPPQDESSDVYYATVWDKYLNRPIALRHLTYPDFWRQFSVRSIKAVNRQQVADFTQATQIAESQIAETPSYSGRNLEFYDVGYLRYMRKMKPSVPRWRFLLPFGENNEKFYEQLYMLRVPVHSLDFSDPNFSWFSSSNQSKTFMEECVIRQLIAPETDVLDVLQGALHTGFDEAKFFELVRHLINQNWIAEDQVEAIVQPFLQQMLEFQTACAPNIDSEEDLLEDLVAEQHKILPLSEYKNQMTPSQLSAIEWFETKLSERKQVLAIVSGGGGVGKSYFLKALVSLLNENKNSSAIVAPTGAAAHLVGGKTIHNFLKLDIAGNCYLQQGTVASTIVKTTDALIIDEFSMTSNSLFDQINNILQDFPCEDEPNPSKLFGGRHVVLIGDPAQLESVDEGIFSNPLLHNFAVLVLKEIVRQKDPTFAAMLSRIRMGELTDEDHELLLSRRIDQSEVDFSEDSTVLVAHNVQVEKWNAIFLNKLPGETFTIEADDFHFDSTSLVHPGITKQIETFGKSNLPLKLSIKKGCVVVLTRAQGEGWPKGTRARVIAIGNELNYMILESLDGSKNRMPLRKTREEVKWKSPNTNRRYLRVQFPVRLGYSRNIHEVQGQSLSKNVYIKLDSTMWASGQAYVALSRCTEFENLKLLSYDPESIILSPEYLNILEWMEQVDEIGEVRRRRRISDFPLVKPTDRSAKTSKYPNIPHNGYLGAFDNRKPSIKPVGVPKRNEPGPRYRKKGINIYEEEVDVLTDNPPSRSPERFIQPYVSDLEAARLKFRDAVDSGAPRPILLALANNFCIKLYASISRPIPRIPYGLRGNDVRRQRHFANVRNHLNDEVITYAEDLGLVRELFRSQELAVYTHQQRDYVSPAQLPAPINSALQATSIYGDGNCFYSAISMGLFGNTDFATTLRVLLAGELLAQADPWTQFLTNITESTFDQHLFEAFTNGAWANQDHMFAMSSTLGRPIDVLGQFSEAAISSRTVDQVNALMTEHRAGTNHSRYQFDNVPVNSQPVTIHHVGIRPGGTAIHCTAMMPRTRQTLELNLAEVYGHYRNFQFGTASTSNPARRNRIAGGFQRCIKPGLLLLCIFLLLTWTKNTARRNSALEILYEDVTADNFEHHEIINPKTYAQRVDEAMQWFRSFLTPDDDAEREKLLLMSYAAVVPELLEDEFGMMGQLPGQRI